MEQLQLQFFNCAICNGNPTLTYNALTGVFSVDTCGCAEYQTKKQISEQKEKIDLTCSSCGSNIGVSRYNTNTICSLCEGDTHAEHYERMLDLKEGGE